MKNIPVRYKRFRRDLVPDGKWGKKFKVTRTDADGRVYEITDTGAHVRISPLRPWRGKSERRQVIKQRREEREKRANLPTSPQGS